MRADIDRATRWLLIALGLATFVAAIGIASRPAAAAPGASQAFGDARAPAPRVVRKVKKVRKFKRSRSSIRKTTSRAVDRGRPARAAVEPSSLAARAVPDFQQQGVHVRLFDDVFAMAEEGRRDASPMVPKAIATIAIKDTQRGAWYGSQGPQRSVIGRTLRERCSDHDTGCRAERDVVGEAVFSTRLASEPAAQMPPAPFHPGVMRELATIIACCSLLAGMIVHTIRINPRRRRAFNGF
jgi:hypothetical protein